MRVKFFRCIGMIIALIFVTMPLWAADYSSYSTERLMEMRQSMRSAPQHEREAFRNEVMIRFRNMSPEDRTRYGWSMEDMHGYNMNGHHYTDDHHADGIHMNDVMPGHGGYDGHHRGHRGGGGCW